MKQRTKQVLGSLGFCAALCFIPGCKVGYLISSGYYQAELLHSREPVQELREQELLNAAELQRLDLIADVKAYGAEIGLSATDNYETLAWKWERTIWNVTGCDPVAFIPKTWWFPIVGRFPYLGYFREKDARKLEGQLLDDGMDVYVRTAGAYSTLGWFKDPILPDMLTWDDYRLADTVLHELAHATLWVPGSVEFNESYANFVGEVAATRYLQARRGHHDPALLAAIQRKQDRSAFRDVLHQSYAELDAIYTNPDLTDQDKLAQKAELLSTGLHQKVRAAPLNDQEAYLTYIEKAPWNNARLVQFKTYNTDEQVFASLLADQDGDLLAFIRLVEELTDGPKDPALALRQATGMLREEDLLLLE
jgi:predicted aminopeptidase